MIERIKTSVVIYIGNGTLSSYKNFRIDDAILIKYPAIRFDNNPININEDFSLNVGCQYNLQDSVDKAIAELQGNSITIIGLFKKRSNHHSYTFESLDEIDDIGNYLIDKATLKAFPKADFELRNVESKILSINDEGSVYYRGSVIGKSKEVALSKLIHVKEIIDEIKRISDVIHKGYEAGKDTEEILKLIKP